MIDRPSDFEPERNKAVFDSSRIPETDMQALMEAKPMEEPVESMEALILVRDTVAAYVDALEPRYRWIINAFDSERKSLQQIAEELGITKTHVWRLRVQALEKLREAMTMDPIIRGRISMADTWEHAAQQWVDYFDAQDSVEFDLQELVKYRDWMRECVVSDDIPSNVLIVRMANMCLSECRRRGTWYPPEMVRLLATKQHDYGHGNINAFGMFGLVVRMSDKVERLANLLSLPKAGKEAKNEPLLDTLLDIVGYCTIAAMFSEGTFQLNLGEDYGER